MHFYSANITWWNTDAFVVIFKGIFKCGFQGWYKKIWRQDIVTMNHSIISFDSFIFKYFDPFCDGNNLLLYDSTIFVDLIFVDIYIANRKKNSRDFFKWYNFGWKLDWKLSNNSWKPPVVFSLSITVQTKFRIFSWKNVKIFILYAFLLIVDWKGHYCQKRHPFLW